MKKIIEYFLKSSVVVNLLSLMILISGLMSLFKLQREIFPNVDFNFIVVTIPYPGTSAEDVEKLITLDAERELRTVNGIEELNALSAEGVTILSLKVDPDYDTDEVYADVKDAMDQLVDLPADAELPQVKKITNRNRSIIKFALVNDDEFLLRSEARRIRDLLEQSPGVARVDLEGYRDEQLLVEVDMNALTRNDLSLNEVVNVINDRQLNVTAGNFVQDSSENLVRVYHENATPDEVGSIILRSNDLGQIIRLSDVAKISRALKDTKMERRANSEKSLYLNVLAKENGDIVNVARGVEAILEKDKEKMKVDYYIFDDLSFYVERRLGVLRDNGIMGIALVVIVLTLFMSLRVSIITSLGAPIAFLVTFALLDSFGLTLNLISMFGLILVLGMLVDDSIIVAEQFYQNLEKGLSRYEAAKMAALETVAPITSTIVTTIIAFSTLLSLDGIMGKFLWAVPIVVIIALIASWFECFFILPNHLAEYGGHPEKAEKSNWYQPLLNMYERSLRKFLRYPILTVVSFGVMFVLSSVVAKGMRFELFPSDDATRATINIKSTVGTLQETSNQKLKEIEAIIPKVIKKNELVGYRTVVGFQSFKGGRSKTGPHYGSISLELTMDHLRDRSTAEILSALGEEIKKIIGDFQYSVDVRKGGPPTGKPVNIELYSDSLADLKLASQEVYSLLRENENLLSAEIDYEAGKKQYLVNIDTAEARRLGVTNSQIAFELRTLFEGRAATTIKKSEESVDIWVRAQEEQKNDLGIINRIKIKNAMGNLIPLRKLVSIEETKGPYLLRRYNRKQTIAISADVDLKKSTSFAVNKELTPKVEEIVAKYNAMTYEAGGENKDTQSTLDSFKKAMVISSFLIFIVLVVQFNSLIQPAIIMSAIPLGMIGVVVAFKVLGLALGFMALMGILGLVGVVINDSIVMITFINRLVKEEGYSVDAVIRGAVKRFRPVILTTFTTVAGLLPVAHAPGGDPFLKPMATSFAYGLLFSTFLTLIFMPASYVIYYKMLDFGKRFKKEEKVESIAGNSELA